jgi:cytochrome c oxidase subunit 3
VSVIILVLGVIAAIAGWWLSRQRLTSKPWLEVGIIDDAAGAPILPAAKIGLGVFLAVASSLFALSISAYSIRMQMPDWWALPVPRLLWLNTALLVVSSGTLQWAQAAARRDDLDNARTGLLATAASSLAFVFGQLLAWRELSDAGYGLAANPANSFFYLMTGLHGLHVLGGLAVLGRTIDRAWRGIDMARLRLSVELCTLYWHFLLVVWLFLFALLTGWAGDFVVICRQFLT